MPPAINAKTATAMSANRISTKIMGRLVASWAEAASDRKLGFDKAIGE
jgi:hypothetical protein